MNLSLPRPRLTRLTHRPANTYDLLKAVAVGTMIVDHIGLYLLPEAIWLRVVGRIAFPMFLFLVGYSRNTKADPPLFLAAGIVSLLDYLYSGSIFPLNILWAIAITRFYLGYFPLAKAQEHLILLLVAWALWSPALAYGTAPLVVGMLGAMTRELAEKPSRRFIVVVYGLLGAHSLSQWFSFNFTLLEGVVTLGIGIALAMVFTRFQVRPAVLPMPLLVLSRYALEIYVLHIALLMAICLAHGYRGE